LIVEQATGKTLAEEVTRRITAPLHLSATALNPGRDIRGTHVRGYYVHANRRNVDVTRTTFGAWADESLVSSVQDLGRFYAALLARQLLSPTQLAEMKTTVATGDFAEGDAAGMGIFNARLRCGPAWTNSGGTAGFLTKVIVGDDGQRVVVIATNGLLTTAFRPNKRSTRPPRLPSAA
jgi:D-alanyl-D-alanine carboxypeptidase